MWRTLGRASGDLMAFSIFFGVVFWGYAAMGHILFGPEITGYRYISHALMTLFRMLLGDFDYDQLRFANRVLAPGSSSLLILLISLILIHL